MKKKLIIILSLVLAVVLCSFIFNNFSNITDPIFRADVQKFLSDNRLGVDASEYEDSKLFIRQYNDDLFEVIITYYGIHDDSMNKIRKIFLVERSSGPEKFSLYKELPGKSWCSRGKVWFGPNAGYCK